MKKLRIAVGMTVGVAAVVIGVRMATVETDLALVRTYELPQLVDFDGLAESSAKQWAVAVDGEVVTCGGAEASGNSAWCDSLPTRPTASTAKMILALAVMEAKPFELGATGEEITIDGEYYDRYVWYVNNGGSNSAVARGEVISEYDALASVMLVSSNNMADTLAMWAFGSLDNYREYATEMLQSWGIYNTVIGPDASGFNEATVSTASDLARIGEKVLENPVLAEIVSMGSYTVPVAGTITNTNTNLGKNRIVGVKTGWIGEPSGFCLVSGYLEREHIITVAMLGAETRGQSMEESNAIVESLQAQLAPVTLVEDGTEVGYYESWWTGRVPVYTDGGIVDLAWEDAANSVELTPEKLKISLKNHEKFVGVYTDVEVRQEPNILERLFHAVGLK